MELEVTGVSLLVFSFGAAMVDFWNGHWTRLAGIGCMTGIYGWVGVVETVASSGGTFR